MIQIGVLGAIFVSSLHNSTPHVGVITASQEPLNTSVIASQVNRSYQVKLLEDAVNKALEAEKACNALAVKVANYDVKLKKLETDRDSTLEDLRNGRRCSICKGTPTKFGGMDAFLAHVKTVKGEVLKIPQSEIDEEEAKWNKTIAELKKDKADSDQSRWVRQVRGDDTQSIRIRWFSAAEAEDFHRFNDFNIYAKGQVEKIETIGKQKAGINKILEGLAKDSDAAKAIQKSLIALNANLSNVVSESLREMRRQRQQQLDFRTRVNNESWHLLNKVKLLSDKYFIAGSTLAAGWNRAISFGAEINGDALNKASKDAE